MIYSFDALDTIIPRFKAIVRKKIHFFKEKSILYQLIPDLEGFARRKLRIAPKEKTFPKTEIFRQKL